MADIYKLASAVETAATPEENLLRAVQDAHSLSVDREQNVRRQLAEVTDNLHLCGQLIDAYKQLLDAVANLVAAQAAGDLDEIKSTNGLIEEIFAKLRHIESEREANYGRYVPEVRANVD